MRPAGVARGFLVAVGCGGVTVTPAPVEREDSPMPVTEETTTELVDVSTDRIFQILASDEFARFLDELVQQTERKDDHVN